MKRLRSSEDLDSYGEKGAGKDWGRREDDSALHRTSSSHRSSYYKSSDGGRKVLSSSTSRYDRLEDDRESSRLVRKRSDYDLESYDRRKSYDRHREGSERANLNSSPRAGYGMDRVYRSESFSMPRRDFPKGFRSERDRSRREGSVTSWRRFAGGRESDDGTRSDGTEICRGIRVESEDTAKARSPQGLRDTKSPAWSKDSGSEQSKSMEVKKSEDLPVESRGPIIEREEGELDPDPQLPASFISPDIEDKDTSNFNSCQKELSRNDHKVCIGEEDIMADGKVGVSDVGDSEEKAECELSRDVQPIMRINKEFPGCHSKSPVEPPRSRDENETTEANEHESNKMEKTGEGKIEDDVNCTLTSFQDQRENKAIDHEMQAADTCLTGNVIFIERSDMPEVEVTAQSLKDKGKCVAVLESNVLDVSETNVEIQDKPRTFTSCGKIESEGTSTRGFQFFSNVPIKQQEKVELSSHNRPKEDKWALELSLSLPNVLLPAGSHRLQAPSSPSHARSAQSFPSSFRTNSDGFTASMSFSGSQKFTHNPSCSLTHNTFDFEQSVGSKPLFQGVDWNSLALDENRNSEVPICQGISSRGNGLHQQSQISQGNYSSHEDIAQLKIGKSSKVLSGIEKNISVNKHVSGAPGGCSFENGIEYHKDKRQFPTEIDGSCLQRINTTDGKGPGLVVGADFAESMLTMIVSEPLHAMSQRFNDMTGQNIALLKEFICDIFSNKSKQWQLSALNKELRRRVDITMDSMINAHRVQLEILVALKTGLQEYLLQKHEIPSSELAEIFLNRRCRNVTCRSLLPADECDCKICASQSGFCRECMCLVCSKFDLASNTCSWVGCDVCLHWCHADCGLRESHIRNGRSENGIQGSTEMQFHCVACDHPSEMFGFVKEVFHNFVKVWTVENLSRELEYVRRIFAGSEDVRGKQLHGIAIRMLSKLADGTELKEMQNHILKFFAEADMLKHSNSTIEYKRELPVKNQISGYGIAGPSQGNGWMKPIHPDRPPHFENSSNLLPDRNMNDKYSMNVDLRTSSQKEPCFDELERIIVIKLAEANMFQTRADDARREAEALKRISVTKDEKIEEEYTSRIAKLRLAEAEDLPRQKMEELQSLERAYQEYFSMKMRMETDIKDLLLKMEGTRRNLPT